MDSYDDYLSGLIRGFWDYAEQEFGMDPAVFETVERRDGRPPVFRREAAGHNILYPPDAPLEVRAATEATIPIEERHRYFGSMRSSQALAQSVFGGLAVLGRIEALDGLLTDEGLHAFPNSNEKRKIKLEHSVDHLNEPRPTSVDVWFEGKYRVAVECKLTEPEFGKCSRPKLRDGRDSNYERDHCDGTYTRQRNRETRCSLTEIGVSYWTHLPQLFNWDAAKDLRPCPLRGTYQLARNVLAACVHADGRTDAASGHALIIYDERNPSFRMHGEAYLQLQEARQTVSDPVLLRSCSWQRLAGHLAGSRDLGWLVAGLSTKYGIAPVPG